MDSSVSFNRQIISASDAKISVLSSAALYGSGIFTTVAIYNRKPFQFEKHWQRLSQNAEKMNIRLSGFDETNVFAALTEIIEENRVETGRTRITFFDEATSGIWAFESSRRTSLLITTGEMRDVSAEIRLTLSPFSINSKSPLTGVKSCNYAENLMSLEEAKSRGFDEAVRVNERGEIASATMANLFWVDGETIYTPSLETGCLEGTTRSLVIKIAKEFGLEVYTIAAEPDEIYRVDEMFLTSAGIGIASVGNFDGETLRDEITKKLRSDFFRHIAI